MKTAIVIPTYNESATIERVVRAVLPFGQPIVVDDHSLDCSGPLAEAAGATVVRNSVNLGYDGALNEGFKVAAELNFDFVVTFDADGQHEASILYELLSPVLNNQADLVLGQRPEAARFSETLFNLYTQFRFGVGDILCGLKAYRMELYLSHGHFDGQGSIGTELALASLKSGARVKTVAVPIHPRKDEPRLGSALRANGKILRALVNAVRADLFGWNQA